jgi:dipeptidyl aminopeptidase/acylaminoacyl peptidase
MRGQEYPGSEIVVTQRLANRNGYSQAVVAYQSEGLTIYALLTIPLGSAPEGGWPAIVLNHGYIPPAIYRTTERYGAYVDYFARNGYVVIKPDYRGHGFSEGEPSSGHASPAYTIDVLNAYRAIQNHPAVDGERVGLWGHSMGGAITLRAMVVEPSIKAGVIWAGVVASYPDVLSSPELQGVRVPGYYRNWEEEFFPVYGSPEENPEFWAAITPNSFLTDLSGPIQLHHTTGDASVPVGYSRVLAGQIQAVDGDVIYHEYAGDNHNISANFATAMARSLAFFDEHVKGGGN